MDRNERTKCDCNDQFKISTIAITESNKIPQPQVKHMYPRARNSVNCGPSPTENFIKISLFVLHKQIKKMGREKPTSEILFDI